MTVAVRLRTEPVERQPRAATAQVTSLQVWLTQRRADVTINVTGPQGRKVALDAKRVPDAERLLSTALGWAEGASPPRPAG